MGIIAPCPQSDRPANSEGLAELFLFYDGIAGVVCDAVVQNDAVLQQRFIGASCSPSYRVKYFMNM